MQRLRTVRSIAALCAALHALSFPACAEGSAAERPHEGAAAELWRGPLRVAANKRYLVHADGTPFFYLGDTNWELVKRANRNQVELLLEKRRSQGFTVITVPVLGILDGIQFGRPLDIANAYGDLPFLERDVTRPAVTPGADPADPDAYDYWDHLDFILDTAAGKGLHVALVSAWDSHYASGHINDRNARAYGRFLGQRFGGQDNVIWVIGGDTAPTRRQRANILARVPQKVSAFWNKALGRPDPSNLGTPVFDEIAKGIREGEPARRLMTFHPMGPTSSSHWFHERDWLDFNMLQSGQAARDTANYKPVEADYARKPAKPVIDGESRYEDHAVGHDPEKGWFGEHDVRQAAYWALFAGAHGFVYGNRGVWQMYEPGRVPHLPLRFFWYDAMDLPGAWDMIHVRRLMLSRPFLSRVPDQSLLLDQASGAQHRRATRGDGYAFIYCPRGEAFEVEPAPLGAQAVVAWWYDPRTGNVERIGTFAGRGPLRFDPPGNAARGNDWVLVIDDAARGFLEPGRIGSEI